MPNYPNERIMQVDDILSTNFLIVIYRHCSRFQFHSFFVRFPSNAHLHFKCSSDNTVSIVLTVQYNCCCICS